MPQISVLVKRKMQHWLITGNLYQENEVILLQCDAHTRQSYSHQKFPKSRNSWGKCYGTGLWRRFCAGKTIRTANMTNHGVSEHRQIVSQDQQVRARTWERIPTLLVCIHTLTMPTYSCRRDTTQASLPPWIGLLFFLNQLIPSQLSHLSFNVVSPKRPPPDSLSFPPTNQIRIKLPNK